VCGKGREVKGGRIANGKGSKREEMGVHISSMQNIDEKERKGNGR